MMSLLLASFALGTGVADVGLGGVSDVSGYQRGVDALRFDPAAPAFADDLELQYRWRGARGEHPWHGVYGVAPLGPLVLSGGWERLPIDAASFDRTLLGVGLKVGELASLGATYERYEGHEPGQRNGGVWDVGVFVEPFSTLSLSVGLEAVNTPRVLEARQRRTARAGIGVRPILGAPWLTLAADLRADSNDEAGERLRSRLLADVGTHGVHAFAAWDVEAEAFSFGLAIDSAFAEARGSVDVPRGRDVSDGALGLALTLQRAPSESVPLLTPMERRVEIVVAGDLRRGGGSLFSGREATSSLPIRLRTISRDPTVATVVLRLGPLDVGLAQVEELRAEIAALRAAGKEVIAEMANADDKTYLVAAAASKVRMDPGAILAIDGFAILSHYFAAALAKIGVAFDAVAIGRYKTGPDPLTRESPRPEDEEVTRELMALAGETFAAALVSDRKLTREAVEAILDRGGMNAQQAREAGLVDEVVPLEELESLTEEKTSVPESALARPSPRWGRPRTILVVPVAGTIARGESPLPGDTADADTIVRLLEAAASSPDVAGVVLRVDSPGGEVFASELIWRAVRKVKRAKPIVASMADQAASGGYYVAAPTDLIFADPNTVTGSIGIFSVKLDLSGLYGLTGARPFVYKTAPFADWSMPTHGLTDEERARLTRVLEGEYESFLNKVAEGRGLPLEKVRELAQGRVYTGKRAHELGLVDRLGGLSDAVREVKTRAGLAEDVEVEVKVPSTSATLAEITSTLTALPVSPLDALARLHDRLARWDGVALALLPVVYRIER